MLQKPFSHCVFNLASTVRMLTVSLLIILVMFLATAAPTQAAPAASTCTAYGSITMGKYWLNNNLWGKDLAPGGNVSGITRSPAQQLAGVQIGAGQVNQTQ